MEREHAQAAARSSRWVVLVMLAVVTTFVVAGAAFVIPVRRQQKEIAQSEVFRLAVARARASEVFQHIGDLRDEPHPNFASVALSRSRVDDRQASIVMRFSGTKANATLWVAASKVGDVWEFSRLSFAVDDTRIAAELATPPPAAKEQP